jgi:proteasome lid subunit RPN8/RPN11
MSSARRPRACRVDARVIRAIRLHARAAHPEECCGLLLGSRGMIRFAVTMRNVDAAPRRRYRIDDRSHLALRRLLRDMQPPLHIVGVYHSHPDGAPAPSPSDIAEAYYPDWIHVIAGVQRTRVRMRAFWIFGGSAGEMVIIPFNGRARVR